MSKIDVDCDLYKQPKNIIEKYEDLAFVELLTEGVMPCCLGSHPREHKRYKKKFEKTACDMYDADRKTKKRKLDKFK